jgi:hypothetical protein
MVASCRHAAEPDQWSMGCRTAESAMMPAAIRQHMLLHPVRTEQRSHTCNLACRGPWPLSMPLTTHQPPPTARHQSHLHCTPLHLHDALQAHEGPHAAHTSAGVVFVVDACSWCGASWLHTAASWCANTQLTPHLILPGLQSAVCCSSVGPCGQGFRAIPFVSLIWQNSCMLVLSKLTSPCELDVAFTCWRQGVS